MMANLCGGLFVLTQLPTPALIATFAILPYTNYPQLVLGFAFNSGVVIGALTLNPMSPNWPLTMAVYGAGIAWTLVYDTVYAYQVAQK
jgi:4-hydroxybenzoate polyprenyltransferase